MLSNCSLSTTGWIPCFSRILAANLALPPVLQFTTSYESPFIAKNLSTSLIYFINMGNEISKLYSKVPESSHSFIFLTSKCTYFFFLSSWSMVFSYRTYNFVKFHFSASKALNPRMLKYPILKNLSIIYSCLSGSTMSIN